MLKNLLLQRRRRKRYFALRQLRRERDDLTRQLSEVRDDIRSGFILLIGYLVILWTYIERLIDVWVEHIHRNGGTVIQTDLPPNLERELDYLKIALKRRLVPDDQRTETQAILDELHRLKDFRHNLIHGIVDLNDVSRFVVDNWRVRGEGRQNIRTPYSRERVLKNIDATRQLRLRLESFVVPRFNK